jgi:hypothetical protein
MRRRLRLLGAEGGQGLGVAGVCHVKIKVEVKVREEFWGRNSKVGKERWVILEN